MSYPCLRINSGHILSSEPVSLESIPDNAYFTKVIPTDGDLAFIGARLLKISQGSFRSETVNIIKIQLKESFYKSVYQGKYWAVVTSDFAGLPTTSSSKTKNLFKIAQEYFSYGGEALFIDEVHKYPNWSKL